jgi:hypothetical protein
MLSSLTAPKIDTGDPGDVDLTNPVNPWDDLNAGLVAWWVGLPGLDGGPLYYDLCGRYTATMQNLAAAGSAAGWRPTLRPGGFGSDFLLDGTNAYGQTPALSIPAPFTVSAWFRLTTIGRRNILFGQFSQCAFFVESSNVLSLFRGVSIAGGGSVAANLDYHAAFSCGAVGGTAYLNGVAVGSTATGVNPLSGTYAIGDQYPNHEHCAGRIGSVRLHSRALSAAEVSEEYARGLAGWPGLLNRMGVGSGTAPVIAPPRGLMISAPARSRPRSRPVLPAASPAVATIAPGPHRPPLAVRSQARRRTPSPVTSKVKPASAVIAVARPPRPLIVPPAAWRPGQNLD